MTGAVQDGRSPPHEALSALVLSAVSPLRLQQKSCGGSRALQRAEQLHIYDTLANTFFGDHNGTLEIGDLSGEESRCTALCADIRTLYLAYENGAIVQYDIHTAVSTVLVASSGVAIDALSWKDGSLFWRYRSQEGDAVYTYTP